MTVFSMKLAEMVYINVQGRLSRYEVKLEQWVTQLNCFVPKWRLSVNSDRLLIAGKSPRQLLLELLNILTKECTISKTSVSCSFNNNNTIRSRHFVQIISQQGEIVRK